MDGNKQVTTMWQATSRSFFQFSGSYVVISHQPSESHAGDTQKCSVQGDDDHQKRFTRSKGCQAREMISDVTVFAARNAITAKRAVYSGFTLFKMSHIQGTVAAGFAAGAALVAVLVNAQAPWIYFAQQVADYPYGTVCRAVNHHTLAR